MHSSGGRSRHGNTAAQKTALQTAMTLWLQCIHDWYPDRHSRTYFLPPLRFNKVSYDVTTVAGQPVLVPQPASSQPPQGPAALYPAQPSRTQLSGVSVAGSMWTQPPCAPAPIAQVLDSDIRDDAAIERFLYCLRVLGEKQKEVMMVISELDFRKYLDDKTDPINAAACYLLPRPSRLARSYRQGDFDVLIIHRLYGLVVAEVKSVGTDLQKIPDLDKVVVSRVQRAVEQLNKAQFVLCRLVSDMPSPVNVTKILILPNITSGQLRQALGTDATVSQALCQCLNAQDVSVAISRCLCADQIPPTEELHFLESIAHLSKWARLRKAVRRHLQKSRIRHQTQSSTISGSTGMPQLYAWWQHAVLDAGPDPNMTGDRYEQLLARFCGPATTVDIPTATAPRKVVRSQGQAVAETGLIVSSLALYPQQVDLLNKNLHSVFLWAPPGCGKTVLLVLKAMQLMNQQADLHVVSLCEQGRAVSTLIERQIRHGLRAAAQSTGTVHLHHFNFANAVDVTAAINKLTRLSRGGLFHIIVDEVPNQNFTHFCTRLYASVPNLSVWAAGVVLPSLLPSWMSVQTLSFPLRCPPAFQREVCLSGEINGTDIPRYSSTCSPVATDGPAVRWLQHQGEPGHNGNSRYPEHCQQCGQNIAGVLGDLHVAKTGQSGLQWSDVIIMVQTPSDTSDMVRALRGNSIPVRVVKRGASEAAIRDLALALKDEVIVTSMTIACGLERRVVVGMGSEVVWGRLAVMSRCTSQLVWIDEPVDS